MKLPSLIREGISITRNGKFRVKRLFLHVFFLSSFPYFIEVQLIYNVVSASGVLQSHLVTHTHIFLFGFFSIIGYCKMLNIVSRAIQ